MTEYLRLSNLEGKEAYFSQFSKFGKHQHLPREFLFHHLVAESRRIREA
jgi:hypothetical protein